MCGETDIHIQSYRRKCTVQGPSAVATVILTQALVQVMTFIGSWTSPYPRKHTGPQYELVQYVDLWPALQPLRVLAQEAVDSAGRDSMDTCTIAHTNTSGA